MVTHAFCCRRLVTYALLDHQHSFARLVANVLSSLAGLSLCQHLFAGLLASVLLSLASLLVSVLSRLLLTLLVDFHCSIKKGSAIEKPYNQKDHVPYSMTSLVTSLK